MALLSIVGWTGDARAADITCVSADVTAYNGLENTLDVEFRFDEDGDICTVTAAGLALGATADRWALGNGGAGGQLQVRYEAGRISNFKLDNVAVTVDTTTVVGAGAHTITYNDTGDGARTMTFTVNANGRQIDSATLNVTTVVNTAPVIDQGAAATPSVAENQTAAFDVDTTDDSDTEGAGLTYTKTGGADQALFNLDADTGVLTFIAAPDFENPGDAGANNGYDVQVTVTDTGALTDVIDVAVTVTDVLEAVVEEAVAVEAVAAPADTTAPTVEILNAPSSLSGRTTFSVTFEFSENVNGFAPADITVANGSAANFVAVDGNTYTADITPTGAGDVTIDVAANVATDDVGNGNTAADQVIVTNTLIEDTQKVVASFLNNRAGHILANQPNLGGLLDGSALTGGGELGYLALNGNDHDGLKLAFSTSLNRVMSKSDKQIALAFGEQEPGSTDYVSPRKFDVWTQVYGSTANSGNSQSNLWVGYFGAHYFVSQNFLIGALVQVDWADETNAKLGSKADGDGWMVGPYLAGRNAARTLSYEARIACGKSDNNITPEFSAAWYEETQDGYTDTLTNFIPEQTISLGEIKFGPEFSRTYAKANGGSFTPSFGIKGV